MAKKRYLGAAAAIAMVRTATVGGTIEVGDLFKLTIGAKTVTVAAESTVAADVAQQIAEAWQELDSTAYAEFAEISAQANSATIVFEALEPGKPFTLTVATTEANGSAADAQTFTIATTVENSGPNDVNCVDNWSGEALPVNGDDVIIDEDSPSLLWNLTALSAVVAASVRITCGRNTQIGLRQTDSNSYPQYRPAAFAIRAAVWFVETASTFINLDVGDATAAAMRVQATGQRSEPTRAALCIQGENAGHSLSLLRGDVALGQAADELTRFDDVKVSFLTNRDSDAQLYCGPACTLGAWEQSGGRTVAWSAIAGGFIMRGGEHFQYDGKITGPELYGGRLHYNSTEAMDGTPSAKLAGGILDMEGDPRPKTISNSIEVYGADSEYFDRFGVVNQGDTLDIDMNENALYANIHIAPNRRITVGDVA